MEIQSNFRVVINILYTKMMHAGYYLGNKFQRNNVQNYLLLRKARQIHRLECRLGASQKCFV